MNEELPIHKRLGQIGESNSYGKMKIVKYNNCRDIDVYFIEYKQIVKNKSYCNFIKGKISINLKETREGKMSKSNKNEEIIISEYNTCDDVQVVFVHNWQEVRTKYSTFKNKKVGNPLYYKEKYEGQIRKANNGQWMMLLIYNNKNNCVVEFEDGTLVDCRYGSFNKGKVIHPNYIKPSENKFYFNDELDCWVGITNKGEEFLFSHPDEKVIEYVKSCTWYVSRRYIVNSITCKSLHHVILPLTKELKQQGYDRIDHINNNPLDNRYENLRWSNAKANARNRKPNSKNEIVGLCKSRNKTWGGHCNNIYTRYYKEKQEALIDLLIMQKMFNATHNEHLFYLLDDIPQERIDYVESYTKEKIEKQKNIKHTVTCRNTFEKVDENTYKMYDSKGRSCLVDAEDIEKIKLGNWHCTPKASGNKKYFSGNIVLNNYRKTIAMHRYLMNLMNIKYSKFIIDHLDGNGLNNKKANLVITEHKGNNANRERIGNDKFILNLGKNKNNKFKVKCYTFKRKEDAIILNNHYKQFLLSNRLQWKTKEELDEWLNDIENQGLDIDEVINEHYKKLYKDLKVFLKNGLIA